MSAYNKNLLQDAFYHLDNMKFKLTKLKLDHNRNRDTVWIVDDLLKDSELIQLLIQSYDSNNFRSFCNMINNSFADSNSHGVIAMITKERFEPNIDKSKLIFLKFTP